MHEHSTAQRTKLPQRTPANRGVLGLTIGAGLVLTLIAIRTLTASLDDQPALGPVTDFVTLSLSVVIESMPFIVLGILLSIVVQHWLPPGFLMRILPQTPWLRRAVISLFGIALPVCECGNVPLARGLVLRGFTPAESITFLLAAPILNPITIVTTYQVFGWDHGILAARIVGGFVIANVIGFLFSRHPKPQDLLTPSFAATCELEAKPGHENGSSVRDRFRASASMFGAETSTMLPALFVGSAIAGAIQVGVSRDLLTTLGEHPVLSVLVLMTLGFVISICANVDAFFALSFVGTFMPGGIVAFLVMGPMIDVKMLALMRTTYTSAVLARITLIVALSAFTLGLGVNLIA